MGSPSELVRELFSALSARRLVLFLASSAGHIARNADKGIFIVPGHAFRTLVIAVTTKVICPKVLLLRKALQPTALAEGTIRGKAGAAGVFAVQLRVESIIWQLVYPIDLRAVRISCDLKTLAFLSVILWVDHSNQNDCHL